MNTHEPTTNAESKLTQVSRCLAMVAGVLIAVTGSLGMGPLFALFPSILVIGAIVERRAGNSGKWLMRLGAFFVSPFAFWLFPLLTKESLKSFDRYRDFNSWLMAVLAALSTVAAALCDVAIVADAWKSRGGSDKVPRSKMNSGHWVVGLVAACLTVWAVPGCVYAIFNYRRIGRADILFTSLAFAVPVVLLDIWLITKLLKRRSQNREQPTKMPPIDTRVERDTNRTGTLIAFSLAALLVVPYLLLNRPTLKTYQCSVALDGKEPFGAIYPEGSNSVVLYRRGRHGVTCFDAFHSKKLHERLSPKDGQVITVEYDTFYQFGKVKGYNIHSVDGFILANGAQVSEPEFTSWGGVAATGNQTEANGDDCW